MDNTEIMDGYDDYDDDYESGVPENDADREDSLLSGESEVDQVARLLSGEDIDTSGSEPKRTREFSSRSLNSDGRPDYSSQSDRVEPETQQGIHERQEILYESQINEAKQQAHAEWNRVNEAYAKLQEDLHSGEIDLDAFNQQSYALGQQAGQAKDAAYRAELAGYQIKEQREWANSQLTELLGDDMWGSKEAREATSQSVHEYVKEMGIDPAIIEEVEDPSVVRALATAAKNHTLVEEQKATIAKQKAQIRQLKKARSQGRKQGRRASQVGVKGDKQEMMLNEVMEILAGADAPKGGRR